MHDVARVHEAIARDETEDTHAVADFADATRRRASLDLIARSAVGSLSKEAAG